MAVEGSVGSRTGDERQTVGRGSNTEYHTC